MPDKLNPESNAAKKPVQDMKSLLPKHSGPKSKQLKAAHTLEAEIAAEIEEGQLTPNELNSSNDN